MKQKLILLSLLPILFTSCTLPEEKVAKVVDSEVEGLEYQCSGLIEYTDNNGTLICSHMPLAFKIGEIRLGIIYKMPKDNIILPQDMVGVSREEITNPDVVKVLTILQSLDSDKNPENGITITKETRDRLSNVIIDIKKENLEEIKELISAQVGDINFTKPKNSVIHLHKSMKRFNILQTPKLDRENLDSIN